MFNNWSANKSNPSAAAGLILPQGLLVDFDLFYIIRLQFISHFQFNTDGQNILTLRWFYSNWVFLPETRASAAPLSRAGCRCAGTCQPARRSRGAAAARLRSSAAPGADGEPPTPASRRVTAAGRRRTGAEAAPLPPFISPPAPRSPRALPSQAALRSGTRKNVGVLGTPLRICSCETRMRKSNNLLVASNITILWNSETCCWNKISKFSEIN